MAQDDGSPSAEANAETGGVLQFNYIKSNHFRVIRADGVVGGLSPKRAIQMNFYSERNPIPQVQVFRLSSEGRLQGEIDEQRVQRPGLVREVEAMVHIDLATAKALVKWLNDRIADGEADIKATLEKKHGAERETGPEQVD